MNKLINIPSYIEDPNYRYKMPQFKLKIEGKGNGIKTNIINLYDVAKALRVPPEYILKFLGYELGSQTTVKGKGNDIEYIINGSFTDPQIKTYLDKFIEKYILCEKCTYPEQSMKIKNNQILGQCSACGNIILLDTIHKVAAYILKNPPGNKIKKDIKESETKDTKGKDKESKGDKKQKEDDSNQIPKKTTQKKKKEAEEAKIEDDLLSDDEKKKLEVKNKKKALVSRAAKLTSSCADIQKYISEVSQQFAQMDGENINNPEQIQKMQNLLTTFDIPAQCRDRMAFVVFNGVFNVNIAQNVQRVAPLITNLFNNQLILDIETQILVNLQYFLLEKFLDDKSIDFKQYIPTILKMFYDEDILTEDFLLEWDQGKYLDELKKNFIYNELHDAQFKNASRKIIQWLKTSEDE